MWTLWLPQHSWHNFRSQLQTFTWHRTSASLMMCNVLKLPVLKKQERRSKLSSFVFKCVLESVSRPGHVAWEEKREEEDERKGKRESLVCKNWLTNKASVVMSKKKKFFKGGEKSKTKKCISTEKIGGVWGSVLFLVWAGESPVRAICPCESNRKSQTVSASKKKREKKRGNEAMPQGSW